MKTLRSIFLGLVLLAQGAHAECPDEVEVMQDVLNQIYSLGKQAYGQEKPLTFMGENGASYTIENTSHDSWSKPFEKKMNTYVGMLKRIFGSSKGAKLGDLFNFINKENSKINLSLKEQKNGKCVYSLSSKIEEDGSIFKEKGNELFIVSTPETQPIPKPKIEEVPIVGPEKQTQEEIEQPLPYINSNEPNLVDSTESYEVQIEQEPEQPLPYINSNEPNLVDSTENYDAQIEQEPEQEQQVKQDQIEPEIMPLQVQEHEPSVNTENKTASPEESIDAITQTEYAWDKDDPKDNRLSKQLRSDMRNLIAEVINRVSAAKPGSNTVEGKTKTIPKRFDQYIERIKEDLRRIDERWRKIEISNELNKMERYGEYRTLLGALKAVAGYAGVNLVF